MARWGWSGLRRACASATGADADAGCPCACGRPGVAIRPGGQAVARPSRSPSYHHRVRLSRSQSRSRARSNNESANGSEASDRRQFSSPPACNVTVSSSSRNPRAGDGQAGGGIRCPASRPQPDYRSQHVPYVSGLDAYGRTSGRRRRRRCRLSDRASHFRTVPLARRHDHRRYVSIERRERVFFFLRIRQREVD